MKKTTLLLAACLLSYANDYTLFGKNDKKNPGPKSSSETITSTKKPSFWKKIFKKPEDQKESSGQESSQNSIKIEKQENPKKRSILSSWLKKDPKNQLPRSDKKEKNFAKKLIEKNKKRKEKNLLNNKIKFIEKVSSEEKPTDVGNEIQILLNFSKTYEDFVHPTNEGSYIRYREKKEMQELDSDKRTQVGEDLDKEKKEHLEKVNNELREAIKAVEDTNIHTVIQFAHDLEKKKNFFADPDKVREKSSHPGKENIADMHAFFHKAYNQLFDKTKKRIDLEYQKLKEAEKTQVTK